MKRLLIFPSRDGVDGVGEQTLANVRLFVGNFTPGNSLFADGRLLPINQNQALFSLLGTTYGGNGRTTFALPDLRGRTVIGAESDASNLGEMTGFDFLALTSAELPAHLHSSTVPLPAAAWLLGAALAGLLGLTRHAAACCSRHLLLAAVGTRVMVTGRLGDGRRARDPRDRLAVVPRQR